MLPTKNGTYLATITSVAVEQKDTGTVQTAIQFALDHLKAHAGLTEDANGQSITGYFNLIKKDGKPNEIGVRNLQECIGWDGSFASLQSDAYNGLEVQIVVDDDTFRGKGKTVKYMNPKDYAGAGGLDKSDAGTLQSLDAKFGPMLRALNLTPKKVTTTSGGAKASSGGGTATATRPAAGTGIGKDLAWSTFTKIIDAYNTENPDAAYTEDERKEVYKKVVKDLAKGKKGTDLTPAEWAEITKTIEADFSPATRDILPY